MNNSMPGTTHSPTPLSLFLFLILGAALALALLAGCRAEDGIEGDQGGGGAIGDTWTDVEAAMTTNGCDGCHPGTGTDLSYGAITTDTTGTCGTTSTMVTPGDSTIKISPL